MRKIKTSVMKKYILLITFILSSAIMLAQTNKVNIFCTIDPIGRVNYYSLKKILPDSLKSKLLIDPRKEYDIKDNYKVLLLMTQNGWKLMTTQNGYPYYDVVYFTLSREIYLDDAALELFIENLKKK